MASTDFIRAPSKKSLLAMLKKAGQLTPRLLSQFFDGVVFKSELKGFTSGGAVDHGELDGLSDDDHVQYLRKDGSRALTANWDAGSYEIRAQTLESDVATGTAPLTVASTTVVTNLNADKLDGYDEADFDYTLISGNDAATDVTGAELEELTDGSDTVLHGHDVTGLTGWSGPYVETDGSTPLTGDWAAGSARAITVGSVSIGDGTNDVDISSVGVYLAGTATMWDDLRVEADSVKLPATNAPAFTKAKDNGAGSTGVFLYWFDETAAAGEEMVFFNCQLPHNWAEGTDIEFHVHWTAQTTAAGAGTDVCWGLEYTWANINGTFGNTTIIYADEQTNGATETITASKHYITDFATISGSGKTMSSILMCRLFRDADGTGGTDDYAADAGLLYADFHYQVNSMGSKEEYVKGP